jgi:uncharacterized membrane protein YdbT with pleckstrin-like domain
VSEHEDRMAAEGGEPALGLPTDRATTLLPAELLQGDEEIILLLKPSPWYVLLASLEALGLLAAVVGAGVWLAPRVADPGAAQGLVMLGIVLGAFRLAWQGLQWIGAVYVLTNRRVIRVRNFFRPEVFQTELRRLQHTDLIFSVRERLFGLGTIAFATAGTGVPEAYWLMVRRPLAVHRKIVQAIGRER